jgi:hypothetical protein
MPRMRHRLNWTKDPCWKNVKVSMDTMNQINYRKRLRDDIRVWGSNKTPCQELDVASWRKQILTRLTAHHAEGSRFCRPVPSLQESHGDEHSGEPEFMSTMLPSDFPTRVLPNTSHRAILESERELRRASCLKALQTLRSFAIQRTHIQQTQLKHTSRMKPNTRASTILQRLGDRLRHAQWIYINSRERLHRLGMTEQDQRMYKALHKQDVRDLLRSVKGQRDLGEGQVKLPWFWRIEPSCNLLYFVFRVLPKA